MGNKFEDLPLFLTPQQLAQVTGEHVNSIRCGITESRIPADKVNGRWRICHDPDVLKVTHAVMPPYPDGAKDADEYLMALRGREWDFEERDPSIETGYKLWYTR